MVNNELREGGGLYRRERRSGYGQVGQVPEVQTGDRLVASWICVLLLLLLWCLLNIFRFHMAPFATKKMKQTTPFAPKPLACPPFVTRATFGLCWCSIKISVIYLNIFYKNGKMERKHLHTTKKGVTSMLVKLVEAHSQFVN